MKEPPRVPYEEQRLQSLRTYNILDTLPDQDYDNITHLAAEIFDAPIASITFIDRDRQWIKSTVGLEDREMPREHSFCGHTIAEDERVLLIPDTHNDERFADNPYVKGTPYIRFYVGVTLESEDGYPLGTLCINDQKPRSISDRDIRSLRALANQVQRLLELRKNNQRLERLKSKIEQSRELLREKNKALTDSLRYAKDIQKAVLPSHNRIKKYVKDSFVLFKPLHIVSGDFYWFTELESGSQNTEQIMLTVADCTGHGVPGGFMSLVGNNLLNEIVLEETEPAAILEQLDQRIEQELHKQEYTKQMPDGMDLALCTVNLAHNQLRFAGALNSLFMVRNAQLYELKGNREPIGGFLNSEKAFTQDTVTLQSGDTFYLSSDGYYDQFGGPDDKKFMKKQFKELLSEIYYRPMKEQKQILNQTIEDWRREANEEQIDDICVMGFRV